MSEDLFFTFVFIAFGFAILPFLLVLYFSIRKRKLDQILILICIVEFLTTSTNLFIHFTNFGYLKEQFYLYYILEIICWVYILSKFYLKRKISIILIILIFCCLLFLTITNLFFAFEFISKITQLALGINMFWFQIKDSDSKIYKFKNPFIYVSIGIMLYTFLTINLFIFKDLLMKLNLDDFAFTWGVHQIAAIIYFSLLSISIWQSQKI